MEDKLIMISIIHHNKNLLVDNIWIYDGVFRRETAPTLPPKPVIDTGTDRFYDNNFEAQSKDETSRMDINFFITILLLLCKNFFELVHLLYTLNLV